MPASVTEATEMEVRALWTGLDAPGSVAKDTVVGTESSHNHLRHLQLPSDGPANQSGTVVIIVIVVTLFCLIWAPSVIRRFMLQRSQANDEHPLEIGGRQLSHADLEAAIRRLAEANASTLPQRMSPEDRKEYIENALLTKKIQIAKEGDPPGLQRSKSRYVIPAKDEEAENDENCCAICLNEYEDGDEVCWSNNKYCPHFFHKDCIHAWCLEHEECPCCRHYFVFFVEDERDLEIFEGRSSTQSGQEQPGGNASRNSGGRISQSTRTAPARDRIGDGGRQESGVPIRNANFQGVLPETRAIAEPSLRPSTTRHDDDEDNTVLARGLRLLENLRWQQIQDNTEGNMELRGTSRVTQSHTVDPVTGLSGQPTESSSR